MDNAPTGVGDVQSPNQNVIKDQSNLAIASLVIGLVSLGAWLVPICGLPLAITGFVLGVLGRDSSRKGMAITGVVLSLIAMILSINAASEAVLGFVGFKGFLP